MSDSASGYAESLPSVEETYRRITGFDPRTHGKKASQNNIAVPCVSKSNHKHGDEHPSLHIDLKKNVWICRVCKAQGAKPSGGKSVALVISAGLANNDRDALTWLLPPEPARQELPPEQRKVVEVYTYRNAVGVALYEVIRYEPKSFSQRRILEGGKKSNVLGDVERVPYRYPEIIEAIGLGKTIYILEGEADADALVRLGLEATTSAQGAAWTWTAKFIECFRGATSVFVIGDNDRAGKAAARKRAKALALVCDHVRCLESIPGIRDKGDVTDWLGEEGHTREELEALADAAPRIDAPAQAGLAEKALMSREVIEIACEARTPIATEFVIYPYLPRGEVTWFEGATKTGKTTVAIEIAARLSRGDKWIDGTPMKHGRVAIITCEDDIDRTVIPRLIAAGADLSRVRVLQVRFPAGGEAAPSLALDLAGIEDRLRAGEYDLLIVDGTFGVLGVKDGNSYTDAYRAMVPIIEMVRRLNIAAILVRHVRKSDASALNRGLGSVGYASLARSTVSFAVDDDDDTLRLMAHAGCNVGPTGPTYQYKIVNGVPIPEFERPVGAVEWGEIVPLSADEIMLGRPASDRSEGEIAQDWLDDHLIEAPQFSDDLRAAAKKEDISPRTLQRAARKRGVVMVPGAPGRRGTWALPAPSSARGAGRGSRREAQPPNPSEAYLFAADEPAPTDPNLIVAEGFGAGSSGPDDDPLGSVVSSRSSVEKL